jgi:hypothetical protein
MTNQPEPKAVYVRLPAEMAERVQALADQDLRSLPNQIIFMLRRDLAEHDTPAASTDKSGGDSV